MAGAGPLVGRRIRRDRRARDRGTAGGQSGAPLHLRVPGARLPPERPGRSPVRRAVDGRAARRDRSGRAAQPMARLAAVESAARRLGARHHRRRHNRGVPRSRLHVGAAPCTGRLELEHRRLADVHRGLDHVRRTGAPRRYPLVRLAERPATGRVPTPRRRAPARELWDVGGDVLVSALRRRDVSESDALWRSGSRHGRRARRQRRRDGGGALDCGDHAVRTRSAATSGGRGDRGRDRRLARRVGIGVAHRVRRRRDCDGRRAVDGLRNVVSRGRARPPVVAPGCGLGASPRRAVPRESGPGHRRAGPARRQHCPVVVGRLRARVRRRNVEPEHLRIHVDSDDRGVPAVRRGRRLDVRHVSRFRADARIPGRAGRQRAELVPAPARGVRTHGQPALDGVAPGVCRVRPPASGLLPARDVGGAGCADRVRRRVLRRHAGAGF